MEIDKFSNWDNEQKKIPKECSGNHEWTHWCDVPGGLGRECKRCGKSQTGKFFEDKLIINPPLDEFGFLDREKVKLFSSVDIISDNN